MQQVQAHGHAQQLILLLARPPTGAFPAQAGRNSKAAIQNKTFQNVVAHASAKANRATTLEQAKASGVSGMSYARMARAAVDRKHACSMLSASMVTAFLDWQDTGDATGWAEAIADARRLGANEPLRDP